jgi:Winged helix-turn helix
MKRTKLLQEIRNMRFEDAYGACSERRLKQEEVALLLGVCERTFRRYIDRYNDHGMEGLLDKRLEQVLILPTKPRHLAKRVFLRRQGLSYGKGNQEKDRRTSAIHG